MRRAFVFAAFPALALALAGCGGSTTPSLPVSALSRSAFSQPMSFLRAPTVSKRKLYVANASANSVDIYPAGVAKPRIVGQITQGVASPADVFVDPANTVYVANSGGPTVTVYPTGHVSPTRTIALTMQPYYVTAGRDGTIYVLGVDSNDDSRIDEFDPGAKTPSRQIKYPSSLSDPVSAGGLGTDTANDLYVNVGALNGGGGFAAYVYKPKHIKPFKFLGTSNGYAYGGIVVDADDQLIVGDPYDDAVVIEKLPKGDPRRTISTAAGGDYLAYDPDSKYLYAVALDSDTLQLYDFQTGRTIGLLGGFQNGVAVGPAP